MKLILAIVQSEDAFDLSEALTEAGFSVTRLNTSGGFLKMDNVTLLIGAPDDRVESALKIIRMLCKSREQILPAVFPAGYTETSFTSRPVSVQIGGATVFIIDVDRFEKY